MIYSLFYLKNDFSFQGIPLLILNQSSLAGGDQVSELSSSHWHLAQTRSLSFPPLIGTWPKLHFSHLHLSNTHSAYFNLKINYFILRNCPTAWLFHGTMPDEFDLIDGIFVQRESDSETDQEKSNKRGNFQIFFHFLFHSQVDFRDFQDFRPREMNFKTQQLILQSLENQFQ